MPRRTAEYNGYRLTQSMDEVTRKANIRLAVILGLVALGFYLLMISFNTL